MSSPILAFACASACALSALPDFTSTVLRLSIPNASSMSRDMIKMVEISAKPFWWLGS